MTPLWRWIFFKRLQRGKETSISLSEKWMTSPSPRPAGLIVWGHAVGVGEAMALAGFFSQMSKYLPEASFLITTTARTSGEALHKTGLPSRCLHQFAPIDTPTNVNLFLDHWQPSLAIWCEMDLWPALIYATEQRAIPHALVNARMYDAHLAKRKWGRFIYQALLPGFDTIWAPNDQSRQGLLKLGARPESIVVTGNIKAMSPPVGCNMDMLQKFEKCLAGRPVWLLASSHPGEEEMALQTHKLLLARHPDALLLIAPRIISRGKEVLNLCPEVTLLRSTTNALPEKTHSVYVADTIGEMGLWYRLASVAMVGGSWAPVGGHNPYEPLGLACAVIHGPNIWNFSESYKDLDEEDNCQTANSVSEIAEYVLKIWHQKRQFTGHQDRVMFQELRNLIAIAKI
jgi:3-deoxy-D-manno-octulosonic-acid transferase